MQREHFFKKQALQQMFYSQSNNGVTFFELVAQNHLAFQVVLKMAACKAEHFACYVFCDSGSSVIVVRAYL